MGWIKNQIMALSMALSSVEKNALSQDGQRLSDDTKMVQRHTQGMLMDSLIQGEVTEEVKLLKARLYKVTEATNKIQVSEVSYDKDGNPVYSIKIKDHKRVLDKLNLDPEDSFKANMVIINTPDTLSIAEGLGDARTTPPLPIKVKREFHTKFSIEKYVTKLVVRHVTDEDKLLEFYIPIATKQFDVNSKLFKKYFNSQKSLFIGSDLFAINNVEFVTTLKDIGVDDGFLYNFKLHGVDKIIEFDGYYVVKYFATLDNVEDVKDYFVHKELDEKYANKEKRKKNGEEN